MGEGTEVGDRSLEGGRAGGPPGFGSRHWVMREWLDSHAYE
jgi:hypothetical protein